MKELFTLIGYPLGHSFSAKYFNEKFARENIDAHYVLSPIETIDELPELLATLPHLRGFNVTIPYKREVMRYLNSVSPEAQEAGAVNCVRVDHKSGGRMLRGYNTDITGFSTALHEFIETEELKSLKALILGSGGAASAVSVALDRSGIKYLVVTRDKNRLPTSIGNGKVIEYSSLTPDIIHEHRLIINTTPLGMAPVTNAAPPFPWEYLSASHYLFDLIYNPEETLAMKIAKAHGAKVCNGLRMLHAQADAAWKIWQDESSDK